MSFCNIVLPEHMEVTLDQLPMEDALYHACILMDIQPIKQFTIGQLTLVKCTPIAKEKGRARIL